MKIAIVTDYFRPGNSRVQQQYAEEFSSRGHEVVVIGGTEKPAMAEKNNRSFRWIPFSYNPSQRRLGEFFRIRRSLHSIWHNYTDQGDPDLILFNQPLSAWFLRNRMDDRTVSFYIYHAPWSEEWSVHHPPSEHRLVRILSKPSRRIQQWLRHRLERTVLHGQDRLIVLSDYMRERLCSNHSALSEQKIVRVPGGVDSARFSPPEDQNSVRDSLGLAKDAKIILTVRRLVHRTGVDRLINAVGEIDDPELRLVVVGTGPEEDNLRKQARQVAPGRVLLSGYVKEESLPDYYRAADLFVLPTVSLEGFGLVTLEALASGVPVLATKVGGTREILGEFDPESFLPEFQPRQWAEKIERFLQNQSENPQYRQNCQEYANRRYSWSQGTDTLLNLYQSVSM